MTAVPPESFTIEVLEETPTTIEGSGELGYAVVVEFGNVYVEGLVPQQPEIVEVFSLPPVGGGYSRVEVLPWTKQGFLQVVTEGSEFPIMGGTFVLESIAARVTDAPTGSAVVLDLLRNGVSIFSDPNHRPTIAAGTNNAVTTIPPGIMFANGDYLEINIVAVGSTTPGKTLTAAIRLTRIG